MENLLNKIRFYDFDFYLAIHGAIHDHPYLNGFYLFCAKYGIILIISSSIYLILKRRINALICAATAMATAVFFDFFIMLFWQRQRPFVSHSQEIITPIIDGLRVSRVSFPSVHTYVAFAIATSVFLYGHRKLGIILFILATLVGLGRIGAGLHYPSDTIAGAFIGILSGYIAYKVVSKSQSKWE
jgi:undecaprenyl-diphosphatase